MMMRDVSRFTLLLPRYAIDMLHFRHYADTLDIYCCRAAA